MILSKYLIYSLIFLIISFKSDSNKLLVKYKDSYSSGELNIDSLHSQVINNHTNDKLLEKYSFFLASSDIDLNNEINFLGKSGSSFWTNYLSSVILKRQGQFTAMYNKLIPLLKLNPTFMPFYDELIFAAQATDNISTIQSLIKRDNIGEKYSNYLSAMLNYQQGNYSASLELLSKIFGTDSTNKYILYQLSYTERNLGNYAGALNYAERSLKYAGKNNYFVCKTYLAIGSLYYLSGKYNSADDYYKKAYKLSLDINNKYDESVALVDLGIMLDQSGEIENARKNFSKAISIANDYNFMGPKALAHSELGVSFTYTNELLKAKDNYSTSYNLYEKLGNKLRLSLLSDNLARLYMSEFNHRAAKDLYEKGLNLAGENKRAQAINLVGLADVYANSSNYAKALEYYKKAREISSEIKNIALEAETSSGIGALNFNLNNFKGALKNYKRVNELSVRSGDQYLLAESYHSLGLTYFRLDSLDIAEINLIKAVELSREYSDIYNEAISSADLAYLLMAKGDFAKAFSYLDESKKISQKYNLQYLISLASLIEGKIYELQRNTRLARQSFKEALKAIYSIHEPNIKIELLYCLAKLDENNKNYAEAENYYKQAIKIIERISSSLYTKDDIQIAYFSGKNGIYISYAKLLLRVKRNKEAFLIIDKSRSRNTNQNLFNLKLESTIKDNITLNKLYDYEWIINSGLYSQAQSDSVNKIYKQTLLNLTAKHPYLADLYKSDVFAESIENIQRSLSDNEHIFSFFSLDNKMFLFRISNNDFKSFELNITKPQLLELISAISPYFNMRNNSGRIFYNQDLFSFNSEASFKLYKKLLKHALLDVPVNSKIIFSLTPELVTIPFEFLVTKYSESGSAYNYANNNYLIDDYQVSYTPSVELYINEKNNLLKNDGRTLVVGNPAINNKSIGFAERRGLIEESGGLPRDIALLPLKYSEEEVNEISSLIRADKILLENNATETNFKEYANHSKIIHLSTHSFLLNNQPVIFLSNLSDSQNDGFLEASEIVQLRLNSDLIVLSSCSSGLGKIDESEGIVGMAKAFYEAGAKSVIVSLWQVNDKYTSKLMALFYKNLSRGMNKSEALRQAKIRFRKEYSPNPYYWSAFILSGDTSDIELKTGFRANLILIVLGGITLLATAIVLIKIGKRKIRL